jgi:hypothetical protein
MAHHESVYVSELLKKESVSNFNLMQQINEDENCIDENDIQDNGVYFKLNHMTTLNEEKEDSQTLTVKANYLIL